ncbi:MAG: zinc ribbon domain-containing protein [Clostridia bacterium]|nr:zinc ribbon domain-containing protein [Clostridia bacterium]
MAKYCGNCGMKSEDDARVCGNCGTPYDGVKTPKTGLSSKSKKKIKKVLLLSTIGLVIIFGSIGIFNFVSYMTGYEKVLNEFVQALSDYDIDKALSVSNTAGFLPYDQSFDLEDGFSTMVSNWLDSYESQVGHDVKLSSEIEDSYKLSDRKYQLFLKDLENTYQYDSEGISEIVCLNIKLTAAGSRGKKTTSVKDIYMVKEDGKWLVYLAAKDYSLYSVASSYSAYNNIFN